MATLTIEELAQTLQPAQAIAGLDLGTKTIGLAMSDLSRRFATPRPVIKRVKFTQDAQVLLAFAEKEKVAAFVIGLPINMDGSAGPRAQATRAFVRTMGEKPPCPLFTGMSGFQPSRQSARFWKWTSHAPSGPNASIRRPRVSFFRARWTGFPR